MRLLNIKSLEFAEFGDDNRPAYVIASHRWLSDSEATFQDVRDRRNTDSQGYQKVGAYANYIRNSMYPVEWLWIDTCCIDKDSAAELSEAINSMFEWYHSAELCLAYLTDVNAVGDRSSFKKSEWFKRGWTLQELLAPRTVIFVTEGWEVIGHKGSAACDSCGPSTGPNLEEVIAGITRIPKQVLHDYETSLSLGVEDKLRWIEGRTTTRPEDMSYALYGILRVTLGANYGEKYEGARQRLITAIRQRENLAVQQAEQFRKIVSWLSSPDPWTNHESARQRHEPHTGAWLLRSRQYQAWKSGMTRCLWIYGKAGCGKTILCSTAIEDVRAHYKNAADVGHAIFYFSFSDNLKQTYRDLLLALVVQLGWKDPGLSMLRQAYEKSDQRLLSLDELQKILLSCTASYDKVFLHLDALDECPEGDEVRQSVLDSIENLIRQATNIWTLVTSRDLPDIREQMERLNAEPVSIATRTVDDDVRRYISTQLSRDRKLARLDPATRTLIGETLAQKADGMFRWVYCQLQELKKSKSTRPKAVKAALLALPATLDDTYERMLLSIDDCDRPHALKLLRWLAYAQSPPSLDELAEAGIVEPGDDSDVDGIVDIEDRGGWEDTLEILAGLVAVDEVNEGDMEDQVTGPNAPDDTTGDLHDAPLGLHIHKDKRVRLAHFSVKEYLESPRILMSNARDFHLDPVREHDFLAQSCLVYLLHYSNSARKTSTQQDLTAFPLVEYAAKSWYYHALLQQGCISTIRGKGLLTGDVSRRDWLLVHNPDQPWVPALKEKLEKVETALYYAVVIGIETLVKELLIAGANVNAQGGRYGNALQAASYKGHEKIMQMLMDAGADVNAQGGHFGNALQAAACEGRERIAQILVDAEADVNAQGGFFGNALQAASCDGHEKVVHMLIDAGADVNAQGGRYGNALQAASRTGYQKVTQLLMDVGADVHAQGGHFGNALQAASCEGDEKIVQTLIDAGVDVNVQRGTYGSALQAASCFGHEKAARILIDAGADVNAQGGRYGNALQAASYKGHEKIARILMDVGANVNAQGGQHFGNALQAASCNGHEKIAKMLMDAGADINAQRGRYGSALQAASCFGHEKAARVLIDAGADVNAQGGRYGNALQAASYNGHEKIAQILIDAGADVNAQGGQYGYAICAAVIGGHGQIMQQLQASGAAASTKKPDGLGRSLVHLSASYGSCDGVRLAIAEGQDINQVDNQQWTPLHWASYFGTGDVVRLLLQSGAETSHQDWQGWTPFHVAVFSKHHVIADNIARVHPQNNMHKNHPASGEILSGYCDCCGHGLIEDQHHCIACPNLPGYDLCFRCIRDAGTVHPQHNFISTFHYQ